MSRPRMYAKKFKSTVVHAGCKGGWVPTLRRPWPLVHPTPKQRIFKAARAHAAHAEITLPHIAFTDKEDDGDA